MQELPTATEVYFDDTDLCDTAGRAVIVTNRNKLKNVVGKRKQARADVDVEGQNIECSGVAEIFVVLKGYPTYIAVSVPHGPPFSVWNDCSQALGRLVPAHGSVDLGSDCPGGSCPLMRS